ncbi:DUF3800 domain-containing protein [Limosilactobacillus fermentum]|uniref:DUF3800 domain-containing protein n=1 Tax=Limosilactobacillus fermentum TaxID=1613 RepID=UPI0013C53CB0|nr:DUF3800 domain-containing protein [Limosilactobacillus fermentum]QID93691.1 DUF3800 domain-containing protein [Limosilactobacillus fermentum]
MLFIDESGSITRSKAWKRRYFVIAIVESNNPLQVKRIFRKAKVKFLKEHTGKIYEDLDYHNEIKGSEMPPKMKEFIFKELKNKTDVKLHYVIIDNHHLKDSLLDDVELCFNFVLCNYLGNLLKLNKYNNLAIKLDERNCSVRSLNSLGSYLKLDLMFQRKLIDRFDGCKYVDSTKSDLVQIADMVANTVYRSCKHDSRNGVNPQIMDRFFNDGNMYFPSWANNLNCFSHNIYELIDNSVESR